MNTKLLFVDDEPNVLRAIKRQLRRTFNEIDLAKSAPEALDMIKKKGPYAVVVSDMRMPGMDGIQFLSKIKELAPETVRIMLTGNADQETAIKAVNQGHIFRFLNKPCSKDVLKSSIKAALEQYRLIVAERELLNKTLNGSIKVMAEILSQVNPVAFSRSTHIKRYVTAIAKVLKLPSPWQFSIAGFLSQIGCVTVPNHILEKVYRGKELTAKEKKIFSQHPQAGARILANIPRLENVAEMICFQNRPYSSYGKAKTTNGKLTQLGGQILKIAIDLDHAMFLGERSDTVLEEMRKKPDVYNQALLDAFSRLEINHSDREIKMLTLGQLMEGMTLNQNVKARNGLLLACKGQRITIGLREHLMNFAKTIGLDEPFEVILTGGTNG